MKSELPVGSFLPRAAQTFLFWRAPFEHLERCRERYGGRFTLRTTGRPPFIMLADLADIEAMLAAPTNLLDPGAGADTVEPLVGAESFILAGGPEHLHVRRAILPSFRANAVQRRAESIEEVVEREVGSWPADTPFASHPRLLALLLTTTLQAIFGTSEHHAGWRFHLLRERLLQMLSVSGSSVLPEPLLRHGRGRRIWSRFLQARAEVDELIYAIIADRERCEDRGSDLLAVLLGTRNSDGSPMSPRQIRDHVMSLIVAGHETTAAQLAWAFQLLAHNPDVQAKLSEEVHAEAGEEYLTATIQEVLRHRPVFLFAIPRAVNGADRDRRRDLPSTGPPGGVHIPGTPRSRALSRTAGVSARALRGGLAGGWHVATLGRRAQAVSRSSSGDARDEGRAAHGVRHADGASGRRADRAAALAQRDRHTTCRVSCDP